jgi:hypothetical protein
MTRRPESRFLLTVVTAVTVVVVNCAFAQQSSRDSQLILQKEALVRRILGDSPAVQRIIASGNLEARNFMRDAQAMHQKAQDLLKTGNVTGADEALNDAMWQIGRARQLVPDNLFLAVEQRVQYGRRLGSVDSLRASYERHLARLNSTPQSIAGERLLAKVAERIESAKNFANAEQLVDANQALEAAEQQIMIGLTQLLGSTTVESTSRPDTPADEYAFELERNRSFAGLVPIALAEFNPSADARHLIARFVERNRVLLASADQSAAARNFAAALGSLRAGTQSLQHALAAAGLLVPTEMDSE